MNITIDQLMATIGRLHVTIDLQADEITKLKATVKSLTPNSEADSSLSPNKES